MATISLPFGLVKPDENTPVTTATEIQDEALGMSQADVNQLAANRSIPTEQFDQLAKEDSVSAIFSRLHNDDTNSVNQIKVGYFIYDKIGYDTIDGVKYTVWYCPTYGKIYLTGSIVVGAMTYYLSQNNELVEWLPIQTVSHDSVAMKSDILTDCALQGEKAKTLDDIQVEIPSDLATESSKGAIEKAVNYIKESIGTDVHVPSDGTLYGEIGHDGNDQTIHAKLGMFDANANGQQKTVASELTAIKQAIPTDYAKPSHITAGVNEIKNFLGVAGSGGEGEFQALSMQEIFDMCDDIDTAILGENHPGLVTAEDHAAIIAAIDINGDTDWDNYVEPLNE